MACAEQRRMLLRALIEDGEQPIDRDYAMRFLFADVDPYIWAAQNGLKVEYERFLKRRFYNFSIKQNRDYLTETDDL